jgi:hypothetical protein
LLLEDEGQVEIVDERRDDALHGRTSVVVLDHAHPPLLVQRDLFREALHGARTHRVHGEKSKFSFTRPWMNRAPQEEDEKRTSFLKKPMA